jgi:signal transduction histidine kinase
MNQPTIHLPLPSGARRTPPVHEAIASRTRRLRLAAWLGVGASFTLTWALLVAAPDPAHPQLFWTAAWFVVAILVAGAFAGPRDALLVGVAAAVSCLVEGARRGTDNFDLGQSILFLANASVLTFVFARRRHQIAADLEWSRSDAASAHRTRLRQQRSRLASEKMASLRRLMAGIAHEMSSPLAAVRAELSEIRALADEYHRSIEDIDVREEDHRAIARDMADAIQLAEGAAERAACLVRSIESQTRDIGARERCPSWDAATGDARHVGERVETR